MGKSNFSGALIAYVGFIGLLTVNDVITSEDNGLYYLNFATDYKCEENQTKTQHNFVFAHFWIIAFSLLQFQNFDII